jgi:hypothetical protein
MKLKSPLQAALYTVGFLILLLLPYHLVLRRFTEAQWVMAWKEVLQALGLLMVPLFAYGIDPDKRWQRLALIILLIAILLGTRFDFDEPLYSADSILILIGPVCTAYFIYQEFNRLENAPIPGFALTAILCASLFPSVWLMVEDHLGLSNYFAIEDAADHYLRENLIRARATFDSPIHAGQWLWFTGLTSILMALKSPSWGRFLFFSGIFVANLFGLLFTGSRGPYVLIALSSLILLVAAARSSFPLKRAKSIAIAVSLGAALFGAAIYLPLYQKEWVTTIAASITDPYESANQIRLMRIQQGVDDSIENWPAGRGLRAVTTKDVVGTPDLYENTFLALINALGVLGLALSLAFIAAFLYLTVAALRRCLRRRDLDSGYVVALAVPWLAYSFMFPIMASRLSSMISWSLIGIGASVLGRGARGRIARSPASAQLMRSAAPDLSRQRG